MKKFLIFGITVIMLFSLAACSGENKDPVAGEKANATSSLGVGNPNREDSPVAAGDEAEGTVTIDEGPYMENYKDIKTLRLEVKKLDEKRMDVEDFLETVRRYTDATKITKRMVAELIDHIEVYPAVKEDGVTNQRVTIHYNCIGVFEVPDRRKIPERDILLETRRGVALSYAPAV